VVGERVAKPRTCLNSVDDGAKVGRSFDADISAQTSSAPTWPGGPFAKICSSAESSNGLTPNSGGVPPRRRGAASGEGELLHAPVLRSTRWAPNATGEPARQPPGSPPRSCLTSPTPLWLAMPPLRIS